VPPWMLRLTSELVRKPTVLVGDSFESPCASGPPNVGGTEQNMVRQKVDFSGLPGASRRHWK